MSAHLLVLVFMFLSKSNRININNSWRSKRTFQFMTQMKNFLSVLWSSHNCLFSRITAWSIDFFEHEFIRWKRLTRNTWWLLTSFIRQRILLLSLLHVNVPLLRVLYCNCEVVCLHIIMLLPLWAVSPMYTWKRNVWWILVVLHMMTRLSPRDILNHVINRNCWVHFDRTKKS